MNFIESLCNVLQLSKGTALERSYLFLLVLLGVNVDAVLGLWVWKGL